MFIQKLSERDKKVNWLWNYNIHYLAYDDSNKNDLENGRAMRMILPKFIMCSEQCSHSLAFSNFIPSSHQKLSQISSLPKNSNSSSNWKNGRLWINSYAHVYVEHYGNISSRCIFSLFLSYSASEMLWWQYWNLHFPQKIFTYKVYTKPNVVYQTVPLAHDHFEFNTVFIVEGKGNTSWKKEDSVQLHNNNIRIRSRNQKGQSSKIVITPSPFSDGERRTKLSLFAFLSRYIYMA